MSRGLVVALLVVMLATVAGQAVKLRGIERAPITRVDLHESRLVAFLNEIRRDSPLTYDSTLLNLARVRDASPPERHRPEERLVAETLLARLTGED